MCLFGAPKLRDAAAAKSNRVTEFGVFTRVRRIFTVLYPFIAMSVKAKSIARGEMGLAKHFACKAERTHGPSFHYGFRCCLF